MTVLPSTALRKTFGDIDIYLFDQLLRGRFDGRGPVLDAGCGDGRNLHYLLSAGFDCFGVDEAMLLDWTARLDGRLLDPIKTTNVQQQRCMTTWTVEKRP